MATKLNNYWSCKYNLIETLIDFNNQLKKGSLENLLSLFYDIPLINTSFDGLPSIWILDIKLAEKMVYFVLHLEENKLKNKEL